LRIGAKNVHRGEELAKPEVTSGGAEWSGFANFQRRAAAALIYLSVQILNSKSYGEDGLTIHAAAFAALYFKLASLDFKLDTFGSPHWTFGSLIHLRIDSAILWANLRRTVVDRY
jgi:hypothetical protein